MDIPGASALNAPAMQVRISRTQGWRVAVIAALIGLVVMLAATMAWLVGYQVEAANERRSLEAAAREADARCFELATRREIDLCRAVNAMRSSSAK
jgi:hypothetical protein